MTPPAVCPNCQRSAIVVTAPVHLVVEKRGTHIHTAKLFGEHALINNDAEATCNAVGCGWTGPLLEALNAAEGAVEASRGRFKVWIQVDKAQV